MNVQDDNYEHGKRTTRKIMSICYRTEERKFTLSGQLDPVFAPTSDAEHLKLSHSGVINALCQKQIYTKPGTENYKDKWLVKCQRLIISVQITGVLSEGPCFESPKTTLVFISTDCNGRAGI